MCLRTATDAVQRLTPGPPHTSSLLLWALPSGWGVADAEASHAHARRCRGALPANGTAGLRFRSGFRAAERWLRAAAGDDETRTHNEECNAGGNHGAGAVNNVCQE